VRKYLLVIIPLLLLGCKATGDRIENLTQGTIILVVKEKSGKVLKFNLEKDRVFILSPHNAATKSSFAYNLEVFDDTGRKIGSIEIDHTIRKRPRHNHISVLEDRIILSDK
jgi:hypothetical protein